MTPGFTVISCGSIPGQLLESELFGHVAGAMPGAADHAGLFELADGSTLFVDEVGSLSPELRRAWPACWRMAASRVPVDVRGRQVDVRVIAASSKPLDDAVAGEFKPSLYLPIERGAGPPAATAGAGRGHPALLTHFAGQAAQRLGHPVSVTPAALDGAHSSLVARERA